MDSQIDLLSVVQPSSGWFCILGMKNGKKPRQSFAQTREEADALIQEFVSEKLDVYFGVAKFKTDDSREKDNVHLLKSLWLDIDCGESKAVVNEKTGRAEGYIDQTAGIIALRDFCETIGLPDPILVNSGRGIHAYWPLDKEVTRDEWEPVAHRLRDLCILHNFYVDTKVFEVSRILRVPGTFNFKDVPPKPVELILNGETVDFDEFKNILGVKERLQPLPKQELSELAKSMVDNYVSSFAKIMRRSANGNGCGQLIDCFLNRDTLSEPRWFNALSIAKFCRDKDDAIHKLSEGHPDYEPSVTEKKIFHIKGPHSCAEFDRSNPGGCDGCQFKGNIKSPISLGKEVLEATEEDNTVVISNEFTEEEPEVHSIPEYPSPYFRGKNGGIYVMASPDDDPVQIYHNDLYVVKRMRDPLAGEVTVLKLHLPRDGVKEFVVPNTSITDANELKRALASQGVACGTKKFKLIGDYILSAINELQVKKKAELMRQQFGWADKDSKFIIGDKEVTAGGTFHSPPSTVTRDIAEWMGPKGSFDKWQEVFSLYGKPGHEPHAFAALSAFGSPLLKFLGQTGAIINIIYSGSGTGKSTVLRMANSVYGHPEKTGSIWTDTQNSKILLLGVLNNLCFTCDEITNMSPNDFSNLVYSISQGRGKHRVKQSSNELRLNATSWQCIALCSSNASFYEKLTSVKNSPDGEFMRLLEYEVAPSTVLDPMFAKEMFDHQLNENYGHAGEQYAKYLVSNYQEVVEGVKAVQVKIDRELELTPRERFWSAVVASNIAGGLLAHKIGLIDWNMKDIYGWATDMLQGLRKEIKPPVTNVASVIGDYMNRNIDYTIVVDDTVDLRNNMHSPPEREPRGAIRVRVEPDTKKVFLSSRPFKEDCVKYQVNYKETLNYLEKAGVFLGSTTKRMGKGMKLAGPGVNALVFDASHPEFISLDGYLSDNAGGESQLPS